MNEVHTWSWIKVKGLLCSVRADLSTSAMGESIRVMGGVGGPAEIGWIGHQEGWRAQGAGASRKYFRARLSTPLGLDPSSCWVKGD